MTKTQTTEYTVVSCPDHGSKFTTDLESARVYVTVARADYGHRFAMGVTESSHAGVWHGDGTSCWVEDSCCVIDPFGYFD